MQYFPVLELLQSCQDPPLTSERIHQIEQKLGVGLPKEYVDFLLEFNGGWFTRNVRFEIPNPTIFVKRALVMGFLGEPDDGIEHGGLTEFAEALQDRLPQEFLPIAHCNGQDYALLKFVGPKSEFQGVWFWDSAAFWMSEDEQSLYWIADSFNDFLGMLACDVCEGEGDQETVPIFQAVEWGNRRAVHEYLVAGGDVAACNEGGKSLLVAAIAYQWPKIVRLLLEHGADPNARDNRGRTPLYHAARHSIDSVKLLLAAGADAKARDNDGEGVLAGWSYRADQILRAHGAEE